jgi:hypothetical protein
MMENYCLVENQEDIIVTKEKEMEVVDTINEKAIIGNVAFAKTIFERIPVILPDLENQLANLLIIGNRAAGKSALLRSLVFYFLIDKNYFTDEMGEQILRIFLTGVNMATRRPTSVVLSNQPVLDRENPFQITLMLENNGIAT